MPDCLSRRGFLKVGALGIGGLAFRPPPVDRDSRHLGLGRVTIDWIGLYSEPSFRATQIHRLTRDSLVSLLHRVSSDDGPVHNPIWYRVADGYLHSGHIQLVEWRPQRPLRVLHSRGGLFEISVPYTRSYREPDSASDPLYRLYYESTAWVTEIVNGSDGRIWYEILDDLTKVKLYARAEHLRRIPASEIQPLSPEVPPHRKRIEVRLGDQELLCFEEERLVFRTRISSGIPDSRPRDNGIPPITPSGRFFIEVKMPVRHMGNGELTPSLDAYELPGVPWVSFFTETGVAFHGTYWHNDFGRPKSHGCVNMPNAEAKWLYRWTQPVVAPDQRQRIGRGTPILVV